VPVPAREALTLGNTMIDICPPSLQCPDFGAAGSGIRLRPTPFSAPGELPRAVTHGGSGLLVYVTLGTIYGDPDVLRELVRGIASLGVRVLVATGPTIDPAQLGAQPPSVSVERWVPQARLWPYVDLAVHHGGSGTMLGAAAAGLPQVMIPRAADQYFNAVAVEENGAALRVAPDAITAAVVAEKVGRVLAEESFRDEARRLREEIGKMPPPNEVARRLAVP
jgi:MGT family glycosyltransferase